MSRMAAFLLELFLGHLHNTVGLSVGRLWRNLSLDSQSRTVRQTDQESVKSRVQNN